MTGTTISSSVTTGVTLTSGSQNPVSVASTGTIKVSGAGVSAIYGGYAVPGTIINAGVLSATAGYGIRLLAGGTVTNGSTNASITGALYGIKTGAHGAVSVSNLGTIASTSTTSGMGILALGTGSVVNGGTADTSASIGGYYSGVRIAGAGAAVSNFGTIFATSLFGSAVYLRTGGSVTNGSAAILSGAEIGVEIQHGAGTVTNFGTIQGTGQFGRGIVLQAGGNVVNGSNADTAATIFASSRDGVYIGGTAGGSVANYGTIRSAGPAGLASNGVAIRPGGTVTNGSATDSAATILATRNGVYLQGLMPSAVVNFGTIQSLNAAGLDLYLGATVTNGSAADTRAAIMGLTGIYDGGPSTITNFATISGSGTAIVLGAGGTIINGGTADTAARITGGTGVTGGYGSTTVTNFGTIAGTAGSALVLQGGGQIINGSATDTTASVVAISTAVSAGPAPVTVANFGSITGGGVGISFNGGGNVTNGGTADTRALISGGNNGIASGAMQASIVNFGAITGISGAGAFLTNGGSIANGTTADTSASITGAIYGVRSGIHGGGTIANFGTIANTSGTVGMGVALFGSGTVINGSTISSAAAISGFYEGVEIRGAVATVSNFGKIAAVSTLGVGVYLTAGGSVTNGGTANTSATITSAGTGVKISHLAGTVANFGTIKATGPYARGVVLAAGGTVVNGSLTDTAAYISANARNAVYTGDAGPSYVTNFGTIKGLGPTNISSGVAMRSGGTVTNGAVTDTRATILGDNHGVYIQGLAASAVFNFGTISSFARSSVDAYLSGSVTNGSSGDTSALITGPTGVYIGGTGTVVNFGTITGTAGPGVSLLNGGAVVNGSTTDTTALLDVTGVTGSHAAVYDMMGLTTVTNFGTIGSSTAAAIHLDTGGTIVNGSTTDNTATIIGSAGAGIYLATGSVSITNFGTIIGGNSGITFNTGTTAATETVINAGTIGNSIGTAGVAITFGAGTDRLVADPGAVFTGTVSATGTISSIELASGSVNGAISGIGSSFRNFGSVVVDGGASWTLGKTNTIADFVNNGTVFVAPNASVQVTGSVDPTSTGIFQLNNASILEIAANTGAGDQIKFLGTGEVIVDKAISFGTTTIAAGATTYTGPLISSFITGDKLDLGDVAFSGITLNYNTATGLLHVSSGTLAVASLLFDKTTLGSGSFHATADSAGHTLITHS